MKERSILFSGEMVRAILDGRKTQTRRVVKLKCPHDDVSGWDDFENVINNWMPISAYGDDGCVWPNGDPGSLSCPYGQPGDRLWVRETFAEFPSDADWIYRANFEADPNLAELSQKLVWRPSIHMPRAASRIDLEVTGVRVEWLQEITEEDARAEGLTVDGLPTCAVHDSRLICGFADLWDTINAKRGYPWADNPWVWVVSFRRVRP